MIKFLVFISLLFCIQTEPISSKPLCIEEQLVHDCIYTQMGTVGGFVFYSRTDSIRILFMSENHIIDKASIQLSFEPIKSFKPNFVSTKSQQAKYCKYHEIIISNKELRAIKGYKKSCCIYWSASVEMRICKKYIDWKVSNTAKCYCVKCNYIKQIGYVRASIAFDPKDKFHTNGAYSMIRLDNLL